MRIIVEHGEIFDGTEQDWANTFFSNPTEDAIRAFCVRQGWSVVIVLDGK